MSLAVSPPARRRPHRAVAAWPLAAVVVLAALGPVVAPLDPNAQDLMDVLAPPSARHWLGTDHVGRDVASRVLAGAPHSLGLATACVGLAAATGTALGLVAASRGRVVNAAVLRLADLMLALPGMLLALLFAGFLGGGVWPMLIGLKLSLWPQYARMAAVVAARELRQGHVEAARLAGFGGAHILLHHVLPPVLRTVLPLATLGLGSAVMSISALGFLGLGLRPPTPEWGAMINEMLPHLSEATVQVGAPCLMIFLSVLAATVAGRSLLAAASEPSR